jgi:hypothetical protein
MEFQTINNKNIDFPYGSYIFLDSEHSFFVLYFEEKRNELTEKVINKNREELEKAFQAKNRTFCYLPDFLEQFKTKVLQASNSNAYWNEEEKEIIINIIKQFDYNHFYNYFKNSFGIHPEIKNGTLNHIGNFVAIPKPNDEPILDFLLNLADDVSYVERPDIRFSMSYVPREKDEEELKKEEFIKKMDDLIQDMKGQGVLHILSTYIFDTIEENLEENKIKQITHLTITDKGDIIFPKFDNRVLKLNHLSKTIYIFYLTQNEPVAITDLEKYKLQLFDIYKKVSYRNNTDSLENSISELIKGNAEGVYVHFSRIKSAINKQFVKKVAPFYCISGGKNEPREILLEKKLIENQLG